MTKPTTLATLSSQSLLTLMLVTLLTLSLTGCITEPEDETSRVTLTLERFYVVEDCDGDVDLPGENFDVENPGEFYLHTSVHENGSGTETEREDVQGPYELYNKDEVPIGRNVTFDMPNEPGMKFYVYFGSHENDFDIFGNFKERDSRMGPNGQGASRSEHVWQGSGWSNIGSGGTHTITNGNSGCRVQLDYSVSVQ